MYVLRGDLGPTAYDVFGTANFFQFMPWTASIETLLEAGIDEIAQYNQSLVQRLIDELDPEAYELLSSPSGPARSTLVVVTHRDATNNDAIFQKLRAGGVDLAVRAGKLRFSPHAYNTASDIDRALDILGTAS